ncbi:MAG: hypothetical protein ACSHX8_00305 [Opitutaceae bacterium]
MKLTYEKQCIMSSGALADELVACLLFRIYNSGDEVLYFEGTRDETPSWTLLSRAKDGERKDWGDYAEREGGKYNAMRGVTLEGSRAFPLKPGESRMFVAVVEPKFKDFVIMVRDVFR